MSGRTYRSGPPAPGWHPPLLNGRPMSEENTSWWPDRRPLPAGRSILWSVGAAVLLIGMPLVVDVVSGVGYRDLWMMAALGIGLLGQAGMEVARPDPGNRAAVVTYRAIHLALPFAIVLGYLLYADPFAAA